MKTVRLSAVRPRLRAVLVLAAIAGGAALLSRLSSIEPRPLRIEEIRDPDGSAAWIVTDRRDGIFARPRVIVSRLPARLDRRGTKVTGAAIVRIVPSRPFVLVGADGVLRASERELPPDAIARLRAAGRTVVAPVAEWLDDPAIRSILPGIGPRRPDSD